MDDIKHSHIFCEKVYILLKSGDSPNLIVFFQLNIQFEVAHSHAKFVWVSISFFAATTSGAGGAADWTNSSQRSPELWSHPNPFPAVMSCQSCFDQYSVESDPLVLAICKFQFRLGNNCHVRKISIFKRKA